jgi:hypothetical protein
VNPHRSGIQKEFEVMLAMANGWLQLLIHVLF